jgi:hypothetical protein
MNTSVSKLYHKILKATFTPIHCQFSCQNFWHMNVTSLSVTLYIDINRIWDFLNNIPQVFGFDGQFCLESRHHSQPYYNFRDFEMIIILKKTVALSTFMQMKDLHTVMWSQLFNVFLCMSTMFLVYYEGPCKYSHKFSTYPIRSLPCLSNFIAQFL